MTEKTDLRVTGGGGTIHLHLWPRTDPEYIAVLVHGYADHAGRYGHVAEALLEEGAAVYAPDHRGSGLSEGERALVLDYEEIVDDLRKVVEQARTDHPDTPVVMVGHSIGGMVAVRYAQRYDDLSALGLVAPVLGRWATATDLLAFDELPELPLDVGSVMSSDPDEARRYNEDPLVWHGAFRRETLEAVTACLDRINGGGALSFLPILWLHGDADPLARIDETREGIEKIRGVHLTERVYPGALHGILHDRDEARALSELTGFFQDVLAAT